MHEIPIPEESQGIRQLEQQRTDDPLVKTPRFWVREVNRSRSWSRDIFQRLDLAASLDVLAQIPPRTVVHHDVDMFLRFL